MTTEPSSIHQEISNRVSFLQALHQRLADVTDADSLFREATQAIGHFWRHLDFCIRTIEGEELLLRSQVCPISLPSRLSLQRGVLGRVVRNRQPELLLDATTDPDFYAGSEESGAQKRRISEVVAPFFLRGQVVGILNAELRGEPGLNEQDFQVLTLTAQYISLALERIQLKQENRDLNQSLNLIFHHLPVPVYLKDAQTMQYVRWNPAAESEFGVSYETTLGKTDAELFPAEGVALIQATDRRVLAGEAVVEVEDDPVTAFDLHSHLFHTRKVAIRDEQGKPRYILGISLNVTERRRSEEAIRRLNQELTESLQVRERFMALMSHELRTPLTSILAISEGLQEGLFGPIETAQFEPLYRIRQNGIHLLSLINDLLDLSKLEAGQMSLKKQQVIVPLVCQDSLAMVREIAQKKGIQIKQQIERKATLIEADQRRLMQMLVNLLTNAIKFTPEGGRVGVKVVADASQPLMHFTVWDTGIGIPLDAQPRLFQPFFQVDSSRTRQHEGSGLGLAIVRRLAELHKGQVDVQSTPGKGSRFTISLPIDYARLEVL